MRWFANYIRQVMCRHSFVAEEMDYVVRDMLFGETFVAERGIKVSQTCNDCGYHRSYKKFK